MGGRKPINCFVIKTALTEIINPYPKVNSAINKILIGLSKGCFRVIFLTLRTTWSGIYFYLVVIRNTRGPLYLAWNFLARKSIFDDYVRSYKYNFLRDFLGRRLPA